MRVTRKDYRPLTDERLDRLRADSQRMVGTRASMVLPAKTVHALAMEVLDLREEVFRLQICETVEQILKDELDDEEDLLAFHWPGDDYSFGGEDPTSGVFESAQGMTQRLDTTRYPNIVEPSPTKKDAAFHEPIRCRRSTSTLVIWGLCGFIVGMVFMFLVDRYWSGS